MLRVKYVIECNASGCNRTPHGIAMWQRTSAEARRDARLAKWQRIPRGDPRDRSPGQRGMDFCPAHRITSALAEQRRAC